MSAVVVCSSPSASSCGCAAAAAPRRPRLLDRAQELYTEPPTKRLWARSSAGEHYVDIVGVAGSIPAAPTIATLVSQGFRSAAACLSPEARAQAEMRYRGGQARPPKP